MEYLVSTCVLIETFKEIKSSKKWRIWTPDFHTESGWAWDVYDLKFYSNIDCTGTVFNDGTAIDSGNAGGGWGPNSAFDSSNGSGWGGRPDDNNLFWIGMTFQNSKEVKCVSVLDSDKVATKLRVQAWESSTSTWQNVMIVENYQSGLRNKIPLEYCQDSTRTFKVGKNDRNCDWVAQSSTKR